MYNIQLKKQNKNRFKHINNVHDSLLSGDKKCQNNLENMLLIIINKNLKDTLQTVNSSSMDYGNG